MKNRQNRAKWRFLLLNRKTVLFELWCKMNIGYFVIMREAVLVFFASLYEAWAVLGGVTRNNMRLTCSKGGVSGIPLFGWVILV